MKPNTAPRTAVRGAFFFQRKALQGHSLACLRFSPPLVDIKMCLASRFGNAVAPACRENQLDRASQVDFVSHRNKHRLYVLLGSDHLADYFISIL